MLTELLPFCQHVADVDLQAWVSWVIFPDGIDLGVAFARCRTVHSIRFATTLEHDRARWFTLQITIDRKGIGSAKLFGSNIPPQKTASSEGDRQWQQEQAFHSAET